MSQNQWRSSRWLKQGLILLIVCMMTLILAESSTRTGPLTAGADVLGKQEIAALQAPDLLLFGAPFTVSAYLPIIMR